jgi:hypothetical protein
MRDHRLLGPSASLRLAGRQSIHSSGFAVRLPHGIPVNVIAECPDEKQPEHLFRRLRPGRLVEGLAERRGRGITAWFAGLASADPWRPWPRPETLRSAQVRLHAGQPGIRSKRWA